MNRFYRILLTLSIMSFALNSVVAMELPQSSLVNILTHDFDGDGSFRVGKTIFTGNQRENIGDCDCSTPREAFYALYDPIVIVSDWKVIASQTVTTNDMHISVRFHVLAETKGQGNYSNQDKQRWIKPLAMPRDESITYDLRLKGDKWFLVDPPLPRIGLDNLLRLARKQLSDMGEIVGRRSDSDPHSIGPRAEYKWEEDQLAVLEKLKNDTERIFPP